jgi:hypothetical protein
LKKFEKVGSEVIKAKRELLKGVVALKPREIMHVELSSLGCLKNWLLAGVGVN